MKKLVLVLMLIVTGVFLTSCNLNVHQNAHIYGVVMNVSLGDGEITQTIVNCSEYGYMFIPETDYIYGQFGAEYTPDYVIQEGDLLDIWYADARDVEIQEIYPGQFANEPDQIDVSKQNVSLERGEDNTWLFEFPLEDVSYRYGFDISVKSVGDDIHIWYATVIDKIPANASLFSTTIVSITEERMSVIIPNDSISDFLMYYSEDSIILYEDVLMID